MAMKIRRFTCYMHRSDQRGAFYGILNHGMWKEINFFTTRSGAVRGNHFSKRTHEVIFILKGGAEVTLFHVDRPDEHVSVSLKAGEGLEIAPYIVHATMYTEDSETLALRDIPIDLRDPDLHKA